MRESALPFACPPLVKRESFIDDLLVQIHFIIVMIRWTGHAPGEFEFSFPGSLIPTFLVGFRIWGLWSRVHGLGFMVWGVGVKAHRLAHHSTLSSRVIKRKKKFPFSR